MNPQIWFCKVCEKRGEVRYEGLADAWRLVPEARDAHRQASPDCEAEPYGFALGIIISEKDFEEVAALQSVTTLISPTAA